MTAEIVHLDVSTTVPHDPDQILEKAKGNSFDDVLVIGMQPDGEPLWISASTSDVERIVFMLEWAKRSMLDLVEETVK